MSDGSITEAERACRRKAIDFAHGSVGLSEFKILETQAALAERYVVGEIGFDELIRTPSAASS